jgi:hypothetical protein
MGRIAGSAIIAMSFASVVYAQETLKGEVATFDEASGKIGIKLSGTVGSGDTRPRPISRSRMVSFSTP